MSRRRALVHPPSDACALCRRERPLTFHHLIPRAMHRRKWCQRRFTADQRNSGVDLCTDCHSAVHRFVSEVELARSYNTLDTLAAHPQVEKFVRWASKQQGRTRTRTWSGKT